MRTPLYEFSFPCNVFGMGYIFLFLSPFVFLTHLVSVWHTFFGYASFLFFFDMPCGHVAYLLWVCIFYFFLYSPYIMMITLERDKHGTSWSFICGWIGDVLAIFQV